jgi:hypothetical protein
VDISRAALWRPERSRVEWLPEELQNQSIALRVLAGKSAFFVRDTFGAALGEARAEVISSLQLYDSEALSHAARRLIGLGPGLTPAGDDWLCGMALGLYHLSFGHEPAWQSVHALLAGFGQAFDRARTSPLSRTLLAFAVQGVGNSSLIGLVRSMGMPRSNFRQRARELEAFGHTSGADMMLGVADAAFFVAERAATRRTGHTARAGRTVGLTQQTSR